MKTTKKYPVKVAIEKPNGERFEARIPLWKAYLIMAEIEREKFNPPLSNGENVKEINKQ